MTNRVTELPTVRQTAQLFLREVRMRLNMDPEVSWGLGPEHVDQPLLEVVDFMRPETVTLTWDHFVHLAGAAMDQQARLR